VRSQVEHAERTLTIVIGVDAKRTRGGNTAMITDSFLRGIWKKKESLRKKKGDRLHVNISTGRPARKPKGNRAVPRIKGVEQETRGGKRISQTFCDLAGKSRNTADGRCQPVENGGGEEGCRSKRSRLSPERPTKKRND